MLIERAYVNKSYPSSSNFFKTARTIFGVIIFQDFAAPSLQIDAFGLLTGWSGWPVLANGKHSKTTADKALLIPAQ